MDDHSSEMLTKIMHDKDDQCGNVRICVLLHKILGEREREREINSQFGANVRYA